jgi:hypothetical protein
VCCRPWPLTQAENDIHETVWFVLQEHGIAECCTSCKRIRQSAIFVMCGAVRSCSWQLKWRLQSKRLTRVSQIVSKHMYQAHVLAALFQKHKVLELHLGTEASSVPTTLWAENSNQVVKTTISEKANNRKTKPSRTLFKPKGCRPTRLALKRRVQSVSPSDCTRWLLRKACDIETQGRETCRHDYDIFLSRNKQHVTARCLPQVAQDNRWVCCEDTLQ